MSRVRCQTLAVGVFSIASCGLMLGLACAQTPGKPETASAAPAPPDAVADAQTPRGPIKTFTLRGIKESPPYLHDGRCLTLEDTVEFFNLVLGLKLNQQEKSDLVAFMRQL